MSAIAKHRSSLLGVQVAGVLVLGGALLAGLATPPGSAPVAGASTSALQPAAPFVFDNVMRWAMSPEIAAPPTPAAPFAAPAAPPVLPLPAPPVLPPLAAGPQGPPRNSPTLLAAPTAPWSTRSSNRAPNLMVAGGFGAWGGLRPGCPNAVPAVLAASPASPSVAAPLLRPAPDFAPRAENLNAGLGAPAPTLSGPLLPFQEAHWQGLELLPHTRTLAKLLKLPPDARGVIVDEATMPADDAGFQAGDLVTAVGGVPTPELFAFIAATSRVRALPRIDVDIYRKEQPMRLELTALLGRLGTANGETAQTIPPGSRPPHAYQGACTNCHRIGTKGQLPTDQGDLLTKTAPVISAGQRAPHENRGTCTACHAIRPPAVGTPP